MTRWRPPVWVLAAAGRGALLAALLWAAAEGRDLVWGIAAAGLLVALAASLALTPAGRWRPLGFARYAVFFLTLSLWGGIDVAWRALRPGPPLRPGFRTYDLRLTAPRSRLVLARTMTLLPGTLGVRLEPSRLTLHLLDVDRPNEPILRRCEERIARLHGTALAPRPPSEPPEA